jgi:predicted DCC family thiol-disulfide oxidoreductase YuxK
MGTRREVRVASPPEKPLLLFDGDCGFCRRWIVRWREATGDRVRYEPYQEAAARFPEVSLEEFQREVKLVLPTGEVLGGAEAALRALDHAPGGSVAHRLYRHLPGFAAATDLGYRIIARNRGMASAATRLFWGKTVERPTYTRASSIFVRLVGLCYLIAFVSLWLQIEGLAGSNGIVPVARLLEWAREQGGVERYWFLPTLSWLDTGDVFLHALCAGGTALSVLVIAGVAPSLFLGLLWVFYLSLSTDGQVFLQFQWDVLLLEAGFLAIFLAPPRWRLRFSSESPPSGIALLLLRCLLFRLVFSSGVVKLGSGDATWRSLTALRYYYETQPLPPWTAWLMHQLPDWFQTASVLFVFLVELAVPFLVFAPRRLRLFAFGFLVALQLLIAATGNYAFFNLLTIALCVLLLDDAVFRRRVAGGRGQAPPLREGTRDAVAPPPLPPGEGRGEGKTAAIRSSRWPRWLLASLAAGILLLSILQMAITLGQARRLPAVCLDIVRWTSPFRTVNRYGLFAVMTTSRPEIIVEGSDDGSTWRPYPFRWKPGEVTRRPRFVAPHQPRLDWQMWFAALGSWQENPWFPSFVAALLRGSPEVLRLLAANPFPHRPPRYVRARLYDYRFTKAADRRATGAWWARREIEPYFPALSREMSK